MQARNILKVATNRTLELHSTSTDTVPLSFAKQTKKAINQGMEKIHPNTCRAMADSSLWIFLHKPFL